MGGWTVAAPSYLRAPIGLPERPFVGMERRCRLNFGEIRVFLRSGGVWSLGLDTVATKVTRLALDGALLIQPALHQDARLPCRDVSAVGGRRARFDLDYVQENASYSTHPGTIRGLHWQASPQAQAKLVKVNSGAILDVIVDIRRSSPTYGSQLAVRLDAASLAQLFVPQGFAHGLCTLEPDTVVAYRVSAYFSREHERGIRWDDPQLKIDWPVAGTGRHRFGQRPRPPVVSRH